jgi:hypothetical protein
MNACGVDIGLHPISIARHPIRLEEFQSWMVTYLFSSSITVANRTTPLLDDCTTLKSVCLRYKGVRREV